MAGDASEAEAEARVVHRQIFIQYLNDHLPQGSLTREEIEDVEIGVLNWTVRKAKELDIHLKWSFPRFAALYNAKARSIAANLCPSYIGNTELVPRLVEDREFKPHDIPFMSPTTVFPSRWKPAIEDKNRREEAIVNAKPAAMTDQFKCSRCNKRECEYFELQIRSCDEPASVFVHCVKCGHHWRIG